MSEPFNDAKTEENEENSKSKNENRPSQRGSKQAYVIIVSADEVEPGEDDEEEITKFPIRSQRMLFVRKVLATVGFQFLICTCFMAAGYTIEPLRNFFISPAGGYLGLICSFTWFFLHIGIACCGLGYGKPNPTNISLLLLSTALLSVYATAVVVHYSIREIMIAAGATVGTVFILALITFHTKADITGKYIYILGALLALILFTFISTIVLLLVPTTFETRTIIWMVVSGLFAVLLAVMMLHTLQLIVGKGRYRYTENDWLAASILLFYESLMFFLNMLRFVRLSGG